MAERTNWVTVKIPETVRNKARDDERTYAEIMEDGLAYGDVPSETDLEDLKERYKKAEVAMERLGLELKPYEGDIDNDE